MKKKLLEYLQNQEIGDWNFPLEVDRKKDLQANHPDVGKEAQINKNANEVLASRRGKMVKITGVYTKFNQVIGYRAKIKDTDNTVYAPKKDFYVDRNYVEDIHADSAKAQQIRDVLTHWQTQHDYYGTSWDGIELFHYELAKVAEQVGIESAGWYKYDTSNRDDMDGKDWRLVVPEMNAPVAINCHSILHDSVWTLNTTIYSTRDLDFSKFDRTYGSPDHWQRTLGWTIEVADVLQTSGFDYSDVIEDLKERKQYSALVTKLAHEFLPEVIGAYKRVTGNEIKDVPYVSMGVSDINLPPGKVGHNTNKTDITDYGIIDIHPQAFSKDIEYLKSVIKHELLHFVLAQANNPSHNDQFVRIGRELGIPKKYLN